MASPEPAIRARALVKRFGDVVAVAGLDLEVAPGASLGLLGPNGAGKTTTIEILEGLQRQDEGEALVLGKRWDTDGRWIRERIGVQLQDVELPARLRVSEVVELFGAFYDEPRSIAESLATVELTEKARAFVDELSGGQRQRLSLACALVGRPRVLFLDEPTTGLDPHARRKLWETIGAFRSDGGTLLLTTHYMEEAEALCDHLVIVDHGKALVEGSPAAIVAGLGAESLLEFELHTAQGDEPAEGRSLLGALPEVASVETQGTRWRVSTRRSEATLPALIELVGTRGYALDELAVHRPTLEDVFIAHTGRRLESE